MTELSEAVLETITSAAQKLTGWKRRLFQAETTIKYCEGNSRRAERCFGWGREAVSTGLHEFRTGIRCVDNVRARGRKRTEEKHPRIATQIQALVESDTQADPKFQTPFAFTRMTAKAVREQLASNATAEATEQPPQVPSERSVYRILNRLGYRLRRVRKTRPQKNFRKPMRSSST